VPVTVTVTEPVPVLMAVLLLAGTVVVVYVYPWGRQPCPPCRLCSLSDGDVESADWRPTRGTPEVLELHGALDIAHPVVEVPLNAHWCCSTMAAARVVCTEVSRELRWPVWLWGVGGKLT
jgi:hypothetical protein